MPPNNPVKIIPEYYITGTTITLAGASVSVTIPESTNTFWIRPEGGAVYYAINDSSASANSPGYIPEDFIEIRGPIGNLTSLHVFGGVGVSVHIQFSRNTKD